jgi:DNA replication protein DnaC
MPYCDKCDKMFATRQSLWKHRQRKHTDWKKDTPTESMTSPPAPKMMKSESLPPKVQKQSEDEVTHFNTNMIEKYAWKDRGVEKNHNFLLPRNIRAIIVGSSGAGKTCLTTYLLLHQG